MPHPTQPAFPLIREFELELTLKGGEAKEWEYEVEDGRPRGVVKYESQDQKHRWEDMRAMNEILGLMVNLGIRPDSDGQELASRALTILGVTWDMVDELELEVEFDNDHEIEFEYEAD